MNHKGFADPKHVARRIFLRTLDAVHPRIALERVLSCSGNILCCADRRYDLRQFSDFAVLAVGKAAHPMLDGLLQILPAGMKLSGIVAAPAPATALHPGFQYFLAGHPKPNEQSLEAGRAALNLVRGTSEHSLRLVLLSGGGSSLMEALLAPELSLADLQLLNHALVTCGASIHEINMVRKHISAVKGGRLAQAAQPATLITLAISDVPVGKESALASGPTLPDPTTCADALHVLQKYQLRLKIPPQLLSWMESGTMPETPKSDHPAFQKTQFELILGMHELFHAAHRIAESEDFLACCDNTTDDWPLEKAADFLLKQLEEVGAANPHQPVALIADGELSSVVTGEGLGGRNSAFVLACVEKIAGKGIVVLSAGTDGVDGNSPAAGAVADSHTLSRARHLGLDPSDFFRRSDSFRFFEKLGDAIHTGPTGNNLRDLRVLLALPRTATMTALRF